MSSSDFVKSVLAGFADALQPIKDAVASPDAFSSFLKQFGWTLTSPQLTSVINVLHEITTLANNPSSLSLDQLTHDLVAAATTVRQIATSGAPQAFVSTFPRELLDFLVYSALASNVPPLFGILRFAGILSEQRVPANAGTGRDTYIARQVHWDQLGPLADSPLQTIEAAYGWGGTFDADSLLRGIAMLAGGMGARAGMYVPPRQLVAEYFAPQSPGVSEDSVGGHFGAWSRPNTCRCRGAGRDQDRSARHADCAERHDTRSGGWCRDLAGHYGQGDRTRST